MKAVCIIGMTNSFYQISGPVINIIGGTLGELGLSISQMKLVDFHLPYYEAATAGSFAKLAKSIKDVKNIIFAYGVSYGAPSAVAGVFLEYLGAPENIGLIADKNIFNIAISDTDGEKAAAEHVSRILESLGAFEVTRVCVGGNILKDITGGVFPSDILEKYAEDYYRFTRQNRIFIRSSLYKPEASQKSSASFASLRNQVEESLQNTMQNNINYNQPAARQPQQSNSALNLNDAAGASKSLVDFGAFDSRQQEDIEELTKLFAGKIKSEDSLTAPSPAPYDAYNPPSEPVRPSNPYNAQTSMPEQDFQQAHQRHPAPPMAPMQPVQPAAPQPNRRILGKKAPLKDFGDYSRKEHPAPAQTAPYGFQQDFHQPAAAMKGNGGKQVVPRNKTCRQMTQSLPHYFQSQLAQDTEAVFQFLISGNDEFAGYIVIKNKENEYYEGQSSSPDITIISDEFVWRDVLNGKLTAQKAFMTGQLKVRGNFMLLNRFDQLYKKM